MMTSFVGVWGGVFLFWPFHSYCRIYIGTERERYIAIDGLILDEVSNQSLVYQFQKNQERLINRNLTQSLPPSEFCNYKVKIIVLWS